MCYNYYLEVTHASLIQDYYRKFDADPELHAAVANDCSSEIMYLNLSLVLRSTIRVWNKIKQLIQCDPDI